MGSSDTGKSLPLDRRKESTPKGRQRSAWANQDATSFPQKYECVRRQSRIRWSQWLTQKAMLTKLMTLLILYGLECGHSHLAGKMAVRTKMATIMLG